MENILKSTEQGTAMSVLTAVCKEYEGKGRLYLDECDTMEQEGYGDSGYPKWAFDRNKEKRLWEDSDKRGQASLRLKFKSGYCNGSQWCHVNFRFENLFVYFPSLIDPRTL